MEIGDFVVVWRDNGEAFLTKVQSSVFKTNAGDDAVFVQGINGFYSLECVRNVVVYEKLGLKITQSP